MCCSQEGDVIPAKAHMFLRRHLALMRYGKAVPWTLAMQHGLFWGYLPPCQHTAMPLGITMRTCVFGGQCSLAGGGVSLLYW